MTPNHIVTLEFFVDYNYSIETLHAELAEFTLPENFEIRLDSSCGGNHHVLIYTTNPIELSLLKTYAKPCL